MTSVYPASKGEQAIARVGCQWALPEAFAVSMDCRTYATVDSAAMHRYKPFWRKEPGQPTVSISQPEPV